MTAVYHMYASRTCLLVIYAEFLPSRGSWGTRAPNRSAAVTLLALLAGLADQPRSF